MKKVLREILESMHQIQDINDYRTVWGLIENAFQHEKITYADYNLLFDLLAKIGRYEHWNI